MDVVGVNEGYNPNKLSSPMVFFWTMMIFLIIVGFIAAILFRQAQVSLLAQSRPERTDSRRSG